MSDIHVGHINHEHYELIGQLADGTPIYRHCPPPPPRNDSSLLKISRTSSNHSTEGNEAIPMPAERIARGVPALYEAHPAIGNTRDAYS